MLDDDKHIPLPPGIDCKDIIAFGTTGLVARFPHENKIVKIPHGGDLEAHARSAVEVQVYERFERSPNRPSSVLKYFSSSDHGIILEYAENATVRHFLRNQKTLLQERLLLRWAEQAVESLRFSHLEGVLHGDINCGNFCLDRNLDLKLSDFAGSSIDQSLALVCYSTTHQLPDASPSATGEVRITERTEIFALGLALYEMSTGSEPYKDKDDLEVESLYRRKIFPNVLGIGILGPMILGCWNLEFDCMADVLSSIKARGLFPTILTPI
jgi:serine/threonine protein kinase